jgi:hypothetical protein
MPSLWVPPWLTFKVKQISNSLPPGIELVSADNFEEWLLDIRVLDDNPLYKNETYRLRFRFSSTYPIGTSIRPRSTPRHLPSRSTSCATTPGGSCPGS